jgi:hypothetical protein
MLHRRFPDRRSETLQKSVRFLRNDEQLVHWAEMTSFANTVFDFTNEQQFQFTLQKSIVAQGDWNIDPLHTLALHARKATNQSVLWPTEGNKPVYLQSDGVRLYLRTSHEFVCFTRAIRKTHPIETMSSEDFYVLMRAILSLPMEEGWLLLLGWLEYWTGTPQLQQALEYLGPHLASWPSKYRVLPWHYFHMALRGRITSEHLPTMRLARKLVFQHGQGLGLDFIEEMEGLENIEEVFLTLAFSKDSDPLKTLGNVLWRDSIRHLTLHSEYETGEQLLEYFEELEGHSLWLPNLQSLSIEGTAPPTANTLKKWSKAGFWSPEMQKTLFLQAASF